MNYRIRRRFPADRRGNVLVLSAVMMAFLMVLLAFAVDLSYINVARNELQRAADSAAMAGAWNLIESGYAGSADLSGEIYTARLAAVNYAARNKVTAANPTVDPNYANSTSGDVLVGYLADPMDSTCPLTYADLNAANAVQVTVHKQSSKNGEVALFFAPVLGINSVAAQATATAAILKNFSGFRIPASGENLGVLPFALDKETWDDMLAGGGTDDWRWDDAAGTASSGSDGIREVNLYPQDTGAPGNRGTVDVGPSNNSTSDIANQIVNGVTQAELDHIGGELKLNADGELLLNGDTGISAGVKDELASVIGQPKIIPIFDSVCGPGNNATYTIVQFAGVRVMEVKLTGSNSSKRVIIQPCRFNVRGGIPGGESQTSYFVYSPVWLVR